MKKILLADDHLIVRTGLKIFIEQYIAHSTIDEACDGNIAFEKVKEKDYDLIILDVNMPGTDSFGLVSNIMAIRPGANILMCSMNAEEIFAKRYLQLGAKGFLSKAAGDIEIMKALDNVINGKRYISASLVESLTEDSFGERPKNPFNSLSSREFEIAQHLIRGESVSQISNEFNLQSSTVGTHKARIFAKLKCKNIVEIHQLARIYNVLPQA